MPADDRPAHAPSALTFVIGGAELAGVFTEATGFDSESEVSEVRRAMPNGRTNVIKETGAVKWGDIELKRGIDSDRTLWKWRKLVVDGKLNEARKDCTVTMLDFEGRPLVTYSIINAWPRKYTGTGFKADSDEVAVETLVLSHEGFDVTDLEVHSKATPVAAPAPKRPPATPRPTPTRRPDRAARRGGRPV